MTRFGARLVLACLATVYLIHCGGEIAEADQRRSERYYEAAYIAWSEQRDNLMAIRNLTRALDADPTNFRAHYLLGTIRLGRAEYDEAEKHLTEAVRLVPAEQPAERADAQNSLGVLYLHQKRYREAVTLLEQASGEVLNREPWIALGNLGWAHIELGDYDQAIETLRRALFDQPKFCVGYFRLGQAFYLKQQYAAADQALNQALGITEQGCDQMQEAHHLLGMTYLRLDRRDEARASLTRCRDLDPTSALGVSCAEAVTGL